MNSAGKVKPVHLAELTYSELTQEIQSLGFPAYRADQLFKWFHRHLVWDPELMSNLPQDLKEILQTNYTLSMSKMVHTVESPIDKTAKFLVKSADKTTECVWLPYENRQSVCISVQSGCSLNCSFCATGKIPFRGNLTVSEILSQVYLLQNKYNRKITNVVYMGMGEPFYNYDNTLKSASLLADDRGLNLSKRRITVSTSGVLPGIERFMREKQPYRLALSLHAVFPEKRSQIMDIENKYSIAEITDYLKKNRKFLDKNQLMFEYIMIDNFNVGKEDANELARITRMLQAKVNLIPINTQFNGMKPPDNVAIEAFWRYLVGKGIVAINRRSPAKDIEGACGMLAGTRENTKNEIF